MDLQKIADHLPRRLLPRQCLDRFHVRSLNDTLDITILPQHEHATDAQRRRDEIDYMSKHFQLSPPTMHFPAFLTNLRALRMDPFQHAPSHQLPAMPRPSILGSLKQVDEMIYSRRLELPRLTQFWHYDDVFTTLRLCGPAPQEIERVTAMPAHCLVTDEHVVGLLDGHSLAQAVASGRLYMIDYTLKLAGVQYMNGTPLLVPLCLFWLDAHQELVPVAIQLGRSGVYTPCENVYAWLSAKILFSHAESLWAFFGVKVTQVSAGACLLCSSGL